MKKVSILGISGSLRPDSTNTVILKAFETLLPANTAFKIFQGLDEIPHFSPGLADTAAVAAFKQAILEADGVIICTPEYAFGVPGTLKNALDWTVATGDLNDKPVCAISASPLNTGGEKALATLLLTLTALGTRKNDDSSLSIPNIKLKIGAGPHLSDQQTLEALKRQSENLLAMIGA